MDSTTSTRTDTLQHAFITQAYAWMSSGLAVTALVSWFLAQNYDLLLTILLNRVLFYGLIIGELLLVMFISGAINRISSTTATLLFFLYAAINGITLASIFLIYTGATITIAFMITAGTFAAMSAYGYVTKSDLTKVGNLAFMGLIGIIIASIANIFLKSDAFDMILSYVGVLVFVALTAYDTQKLKTIGAATTDMETQNKAAVLGALTLYLDFINLFLFILKILGGRKRT